MSTGKSGSADDSRDCIVRSVDEKLRKWQERWQEPERRMVKTVCEYAMKRLEEEIRRFEGAPSSLTQAHRRTLSRT
jgi:hypothetical protein